ncbi:hypothetical protein H2O64_01190 [Kordia sp. YSTF-M3]|uniref:Uncharacterized protein n=1 Tax=Kordia aestuariivivens TaxID=2759037 RepID=A0ABR7Q3X4_9FLAO|nr:hypothetical protein [Kordia aestuariivivens]MBC8753264.1 hypothetical protein [Kordia aestuariivivens]
MKQAKFINENPLAKVEHLIHMLCQETLLKNKIDEIYKLLQNEIPLSDKKLLEIEVARFDYQYPFYCEIDSNKDIKESTLIKKDTLINHIKREVRFNNLKDHYLTIQNYSFHEEHLNSKKDNFHGLGNLAFNGCGYVLLPYGAIAIMIIIFLDGLFIKDGNSLIWTIIFILIGIFLISIIFYIAESKVETKLDKLKELRQKEIELLKFKINGHHKNR